MPQRGGVKRADLNPIDSQSMQSGAHFSGRPRGERDRQGTARIVLTRSDGMRNAVGDGSRLAGACTREDGDRTMQCLSCGTLLIVESIQGGHGCDVATPT